MARFTSRREFLRQSALAGTGLLAAASADADPLARSPIIDTHQHLWDFRRFRPPWLKGEPKLNRSYTMDDYRKATAGLNVVKTIYMEVDVTPEQQVAEGNYVTSICRAKNTPMVAAVVSCRPALPGFEAYVRRFEGNPYIKGVRQVLQVPEAPKGLCLRTEYVRNIQLLGELGLSFDICIRPTELTDAAELIDLCPGTRFVLDHCGNASARNTEHAQWKKDIAEIAKRPNVVCKVSGIIKTVKPEWDPARELEPIVKHVFASFGPERVMFGGDWPVCNLTFSFRAWVEALRWILRDVDMADQRKFYHDNAVHFYRLA